MAERAAVFLVALAAGIGGLAWLHSARLEKEAQSLANRDPKQQPPALVARAVSMFERARAHNPDTRPIVFEAGLLERHGRNAQAIALLRPVVRREPGNNTAWALLAAASANAGDKALNARAVAHADALNPLAAQAP